MCTWGLVNPPALSPGLDVATGRVMQFRAGVLTFCECEAGQQYRVGLMKRNDAPDQDVIQAQARAEAAKRRKEKLWDDANVPPRFANFTFKGYADRVKGDPGKERIVSAILSHFRGQNPRLGLMLCGPTGMGKTGALSPLFLHYLDEGYAGLWLPYFEMMAAFRDFDGRPGQVSERVKLAQEVNLLFIDDMGDPKRMSGPKPEGATHYEREVVFRLVDHRNNYGLPMFITSNLPVDRLEEYYRPEIVKRLEEACEIVPVTGGRLV